MADRFSAFSGLSHPVLPDLFWIPRCRSDESAGSMKSVIRGPVAAITAVAASAMAGCVTLFLSFWLLSMLFAAILPHTLNGHGWPRWRPIVGVGMVVCAVAVARYVWRLILPERAIGVTHDVGVYGPAGATDAPGRAPSSRFGVALRWALLSTLLAFAVMFFTPLVVGGPGGSMAPLFAVLLAPIIFVITLGLALISPRLGIVIIVASLLFPVWYYVQSPQRRPEGTLLPLNTDERALIKSRHLDLRVAVDAGRFPPVYRESLLTDLGRTGLFTEVGPIERTRSPDLIATVTGNYYGDTTGHSFSLNWAKQPERKVNVRVWHDVRLSFDSLRGRERQLELERLALEVIRQMDALGPPPHGD